MREAYYFLIWYFKNELKLTLMNVAMPIAVTSFFASMYLAVNHDMETLHYTLNVFLWSMGLMASYGLVKMIWIGWFADSWKKYQDEKNTVFNNLRKQHHNYDDEMGMTMMAPPHSHQHTINKAIAAMQNQNLKQTLK